MESAELRDKVKEAMKEALMESFSCVFSLVPKVAEIEPYIPEDTGRKVFSSLGFTGGIDGAVVIVLPEKSACEAVSKMLGCEFDKVNQDVLDGAGELANILTGGLKTGLSGAGCTFDVSIPTVVHMERFIEVARIMNTERICMRVDAPDMGFDLFISFSTGGEKKPGEAKRASREKAGKGDGDASSALQDLIKE